MIFNRALNRDRLEWWLKKTNKHKYAIGYIYTLWRGSEQILSSKKPIHPLTNNSYQTLLRVLHDDGKVIESIDMLKNYEMEVETSIVISWIAHERDDVLYLLDVLTYCGKTVDVSLGIISHEPDNFIY